MDAKLEALAGYVLEGLTKQTLSDAAVHEFTAQGCKCIQNETEICWAGNIGKLWEYLSSGRTALAYAEKDVCNAFRQGRLYTVMELLKMTQEWRVSEATLKQDARDYTTRNRSGIFLALKDGRSLTHRELANACKLSDSSLSQFMHSIEPKNYIHSRKVGRTKYYRLSNRGEKLLECMQVSCSTNIVFSQISSDNSFMFQMVEVIPGDGKRLGIGKPMNFATSYVALKPHPHKCGFKQLEKTEGNRYIIGIS